MRETVAIPAGILIYFMSVILLLIFIQLTFANPADWSTFITVLIAIISFKLTCALVKNFTNEEGVKVVGVMISSFWLLSLGIDFFSDIENFLKFLGGGQESKTVEEFQGFVESVWNAKLYAIISVLLAMWTLNK